MKTAFGLFSGLIAICLTVGVFFLHKRGFQNRRLIYVLFIFSLLTVLSNGLAVNVRTKGAADLCYEIYYIASNWLLFLLVYHADRKRTQAGKKSFIVVLCEVLCVVDTTFLGINFWLHSIFETQELALRNGGRMFQPLYHTGSFGFFVHILLRCSITFLLFYLYLCLMRGTIRLYRSRYRNVVWLIVFMIVIVTGCRYYECPIDVASILYAVLASVCVYYSFFYVSKGMVAKVLSLLIEDTQQGIVCFDKDGRCIQANDAYKRLYDHESTKEDYERHFAEWRGQRGELRRRSRMSAVS